MENKEGIITQGVCKAITSYLMWSIFKEKGYNISQATT